MVVCESGERGFGIAELEEVRDGRVMSKMHITYLEIFVFLAQDGAAALSQQKSVRMSLDQDTQAQRR